MIKKFLIGVTAGTLILAAFAVSVFAKVERVPGPEEFGPWNLIGECQIAYTGVNIAPGPYVHTYNIGTMDLSTGEFSGTGSYDPNPAYTEDIDGTVTGSNIDFHVLYTGLNSGYTVDAEGVINNNGSLTGIATSSSNQTFTFASTGSCATRTSTQFEGNHGQYVKSMDDKQEAAQSRVGMPVQSKGHTK